MPIRHRTSLVQSTSKSVNRFHLNRRFDALGRIEGVRVFLGFRLELGLHTLKKGALICFGNVLNAPGLKRLVDNAERPAMAALNPFFSALIL